MIARTPNSVGRRKEGDLDWVVVVAISGESILLVQDADAPHPDQWQLPRKRTLPIETLVEAARRILGRVMRTTVYARDFDLLDSFRFGPIRAKVYLIQIPEDAAMAFEGREKNSKMRGKFFPFKDILTTQRLNNEDRPFLTAMITPEECDQQTTPPTS